MIAELRYKHNENEVSVTGNITYWDNYASKFKDGSVQHHYVPPVVVQDIWNGKEITPQITKWDCYYLEFNIKQSEIFEIGAIKSSSDIQIVQYNRDSNGIIIDKNYILDLTSSDLIDISEPERIENTTAYKVSIVYRTERTVINRGNAKNNTYNIKIQTTNWEHVLSDSAPIGTNYIECITATRMAVITDGILQSYDLINEKWVAIGSPVDTGYNTEQIAIAKLDNNTIAIAIDTVDKLETYTFNGTVWAQTGSTFTFATSKTSISITKIDTYVIGLMDTENKGLETYTFDGSVWTKTGNSLAITIASPATLGICSMDTDEIAYIDSVNSELRSYSWNGTDWTNDYSDAFTLGDNLLITELTATEVAIIDTDNNLLKKYTTSGTAWSETLSSAISETYSIITTLTTDTIVTGVIDFSQEWVYNVSTFLDIHNRTVVSLSETRIAVVMVSNSNNAEIYTYDFNASTEQWEQVGNEFLTTLNGNGNYFAATKLTSSQIAVYTQYDDELATFSFDGTDWSLVGNIYSVTNSSVQPRICALTSTRIVIVTGPSSANCRFEALDFDGTDWAVVGSTFILGIYPNSNGISIAALSSTDFVYYDGFNKQIRTYNFNGSVFALSYFGTDVALGNNVYITTLSSTEIALVDADNDTLAKYTTNGSAWSQQYDSIILPVAGVEFDSLTALSSLKIVYFQSNSFSLRDYQIEVVNENEFDNYTAGSFNYYTDYDLIIWNKPTESVLVPWSDGGQKLLQSINKSGYKALMYLTPENLDLFLTRFKASGAMVINGQTIDEVEFEAVEIGENYQKLIISGIYDVDITNYDSSPNNTYLLNIITSTGTYPFYTDYAIKLISETPNIDSVENETGINTATKSITKEVKQGKFYLSESDAFSLKERFETFTSATLNGEAVKEIREISPSELGEDIYEVIVNCLIGTIAT